MVISPDVYGCVPFSKGRQNRTSENTIDGISNLLDQFTPNLAQSIQKPKTKNNTPPHKIKKKTNNEKKKIIKNNKAK